MIRPRPLILAGILFAVGAGASEICEIDDEALLWSSCGGGSVSVLLLPEDRSVTPASALDVTGGYTAVDKRRGGSPKPVGLFVRRGEVVSREYVRFDGVLIVDAAGAPTILHRRRANFSGEVYDLDDPAARSRFLSAAAVAGASVLQSHLLIVDGVVDAFPREGDPLFRRRILVQMADGSFGVYDSSPRALTLAAATEEAARAIRPRMALNLDMGSYDFCSFGAETCGVLSVGEMSKLSNLLRFAAP